MLGCGRGDVFLPKLFFDLFILEQHGDAPRQQHAKGEDEENAACLEDADMMFDVVVQGEAHHKQSAQNDDEGAGLFQIDVVPFNFKRGCFDEWQREEQGSHQKGQDRPRERDAAFWKHEHQETGAHPQGRYDDFFC